MREAGFEYSYKACKKSRYGNCFYVTSFFPGAEKDEK